MSRDSIFLAADDRGVYHLQLDRPSVRNAMNVELIREVAAALDEVQADADARVLVLTGAGDTFCAGGDLAWMRAMTTQDRAQREAEAGELADMLHRLDTFPLPVIGRINGQAYGGGVGLISCCDLAIGVDSARFALTEVRLGLIPATISPYVVHRIGAPAARRILLCGRRFDAAEAVRIGLLADCVPAGELDAAVEKEIGRFLACAPGAVAATKDLVHFVAGADPATARTQTPRRLADTWETDEARAGIAAFLEKREPPWRGGD